MATVLIGDVYLLSIAGRVFGQRTLNTFHYRIEDNQAEFDDDQMSDALRNAFIPAIANPATIGWSFLECVPPEWTFEELWVQAVSPIRYRKHIYPQTKPGAYEGEATVPNVAAVITRQTEFAGRDQISNLHVGPIDVSGAFAAEGVLTTDGTVKLASLTTALLEDLPVGGGAQWSARPVIYHPNKTDPPNFNYIVGANVQSTTRTMRRRTVGRGE